MSTLPTLIDELRKCEREWDGSNMFELARMCRDAADMLDENAKLRELVRFANKTVEGLCEMVENSPGCSMCPLNQDEDSACGAAELFGRMCELGVEVNV